MNTHFKFKTVAQIEVAFQGARNLGQVLSEWTEKRRILLVTDRGIKESGILKPVVKSLESHGFHTFLFDQVLADPPESLIMSCTELVKKNNCELIIGLGGGSSMDVAKLVSVMACSRQSLQDLYGIDKITGARLPLIQIPTTAGTGSEVTNITILTTGENSKMGVVSDLLYADLVLLDAELTTGLPPLHTAATGIDAMVHAIEAYTSVHKKNPLSDNLARGALTLLSQNLITACRDGSNIVARENMLIGAMMAGQAFSNAPVAAVHALAYPLGARFHLPHGLTNALMLIPVLRFNLPAAKTQYAELTRVINPQAQGNELQLAEQFIDIMENLILKSKSPSRLRDVDIQESALPQLAKDAMLQQRLLQNNPVNVTESDALFLYQQAW